ncbi:MAG: anti-sigma factor [Ilumatobacteraceae bacterium]
MSADEFELNELLGAYALDAVDPDERLAIEQYLAVDPRARREVEEHREVATIMAWTTMAAPEGLWDRIAGNLEDAAPQPSGELASVLSLDNARHGRTTRRWQSLGSWAVASAAAAVVAVLVVNAVASNGSEEPPLAMAVAEARADRDSATTQLVRSDGSVGGEAIIDQDGHGYLLGDSLPELPADQTYQLWGVIGDQVISLGVLGHNPEIELFSAGAPVSQLVVTIEQAGGVVSNGNPDGAYAGTLG